MPVGMRTLERNTDNFFAGGGQAAFWPADIVAGVEPSTDKLLQGRVFSYADTQRHRLGPNFQQLPVNRPLVEVRNNQRDGFMQQSIPSGTVNYEPNSLAAGMPSEAPPAPMSRNHIEGEATQQRISKTEDFYQAGERYRSLGKMDRDHLVGNLVDDLGKADKKIQKRMVKNLSSADAAMGKRVAKGLKL